jgi:hypothetical protein
MKRLVLLLALLAAPAAAQEPTSPALPRAESSDEVVVTALRIPRDKLPTRVYWDLPYAIPARIQYQRTELFVRCALRLTDAAWVRKVVDGVPNSTEATFAQGWILRTNGGCYQPLGMNTVGQLQQPSRQDDLTDIGRSTVDRGIIIEGVLRTYAPDAALTPEITRDPAVKTRFNAREGVRNRLRFRGDRDALVFSSCLVEQQPVLATRLMRSRPGSTLEKGLTQALLIEARGCLGAVDRVTINPTLARTYVADAFYRWVVAARGVDTLIDPAALRTES